MKTILFMGGDTHEMSLVPVEIDDSQFARQLAERGVTRLRRAGESKRLQGGVERSILSSPLFTEESQKLDLGGAYGFVRELSEDEASQLRTASDAYVAQRNAKLAAQAPPSLIAQGRACYSCGRPRKVRNGECVYCGADA